VLGPFGQSCAGSWGETVGRKGRTGASAQIGQIVDTQQRSGVCEEGVFWADAKGVDGSSSMPVIGMQQVRLPTQGPSQLQGCHREESVFIPIHLRITAVDRASRGDGVSRNQVNRDSLHIPVVGHGRLGSISVGIH
jgi:hypothetical protein